MKKGGFSTSHSKPNPALDQPKAQDIKPDPKKKEGKPQEKADTP